MKLPALKCNIGNEGKEMSLEQSLLYFVVSLAASIVGAVCGIGGGVIIKPTLDMFGWASVSTISFLSGCTVLSMSFYSAVKSMISHDRSVDIKTGTPLAIGAALGGILGKQMFVFIRNLSDESNAVSVVQSICLAVITLGTLIYTINKTKIKSHIVKKKISCLLIGLVLGICSSFLGIGGGPINLVVLCFFFGMDTKAAAVNSLYIIMFSQLFSLIYTIIIDAVPKFSFITLAFMVCGGILGGFIGRILNKKLNNAAVDKLFIILMVLIIGISIYNILVLL